MKPFLRRSALAFLGVAAVIQAVPAGRTNPPQRTDPGAPAEAIAILRRSCYDCHSNETRWPWYGRVAPVSWLLVRDVQAGRSHLNFSLWGEYAESKRRTKAEAAIDEIVEDRMPPASYVRMHPEAALSDEDVEVLRAWAELRLRDAARQPTTPAAGDRAP